MCSLHGRLRFSGPAIDNDAPSALCKRTQSWTGVWRFESKLRSCSLGGSSVMAAEAEKRVLKNGGHCRSARSEEFVLSPDFTPVTKVSGNCQSTETCTRTVAYPGFFHLPTDPKIRYEACTGRGARGCCGFCPPVPVDLVLQRLRMVSGICHCNLMLGLQIQEVFIVKRLQPLAGRQTTV